jgi:hypothetical protein
MYFTVGIDSRVMIYIQSSTNIIIGLQAIFRFCHNSLKGCNVGITDGREL